jgi:GTPase Era involved in 16S rRNA processing
LQSLSQDRKIGIISIVGKYRTGKSFFVNRVLLDKSGVNCGFTVGPTINPCTKVIIIKNKKIIYKFYFIFFFIIKI